MDSKTAMELNEAERRMIEQIRGNPRLGERIHHLLASGRAEQLEQASADEAEERIAEQMRAVAEEVMGGWAEAVERQAGERLCASDPTARVRTKKNCAGTARWEK
jgi:hypothetical protein